MSTTRSPWLRESPETRSETGHKQNTVSPTFLNKHPFGMARYRGSYNGFHLKATVRTHASRYGNYSPSLRSGLATRDGYSSMQNNRRIKGTLPQRGSPFFISWPSFTLTSTTTPDIVAPTDPGSLVAFSRETVSTAEFLSSMATARTCSLQICQALVNERRRSVYLSIYFEPNVSLGLAFDNRTDGHQTDDESLPFLDGYVHLLSDLWTS